MAAVTLIPSSPAPTYNTASPKFGTAARASGYGVGPLLPAGSFTVEAQVRTSASGSIMVAAGQSFVCFIGMQANGNAFAHYGSGSDVELASTVKINDGAYHHLELCYDPAVGGKLFVDGVLVAQSTVRPSFNAGDEFAFGDFGASYAYRWQGDIDEGAIWSIARHSASFTPPSAAYAGNETDLAHLYHFDGDLADSVGQTAAPAPAPTVTIPVTDPAFHFSPANWRGDTGRGGSAWRQTWNCGAYFDLVVQAGPSPSLSLLLGSNADSLPVSYLVNGVLTDNVATASQTSIAISGLTPNALNTVSVYVRSSPSASRWGGTNTLRVLGAAIDTGSTAGTAATPAKWVLYGGDSINEGWVVDGGANNFLHASTWFVVQELRRQGYDVGVVAATGSGFTVSGNGGVIPLYGISGGVNSDAASRWNKVDAGVSLLDSAGQISAYGATGTPPAVIFWNYGTNDANQGAAAAAVTASVRGVLGAYASAAANAKIVLVPGLPLNTGAASNASATLAAIKAGFDQAVAVNPGAALTYADLGPGFASQVYGVAANRTDPVHPSFAGNAFLVAPFLGLIAQKLAPAAANGNAVLPQFRSGFR